MTSLRHALQGIGEPAQSPFALRASFGGRTPRSLRTAIDGMRNPDVGAWHEVGVALSEDNTDFANNTQGATTDGSRWYVCSNNLKCVVGFEGTSHAITYTPTNMVVYMLWQDDGAPPVDSSGGFPVMGSTYMTVGDGGQLTEATWDPHFGAPSFFDGSIDVPIQGSQVRGVWRFSIDGQKQQWLKASDLPETDLFPWCATHPVTGLLYTCNYTTPEMVFSYDRETLAFRAENSFTIHGRPTSDLDSVQCGFFTKHGRLILVRSDDNAIFCFSALNGHYFGAQQLGDFGNDNSEVESVTVLHWQFDGIPAQVHICELAGWPDQHTFYLHSFQVPDPGRL